MTGLTASARLAKAGTSGGAARDLQLVSSEIRR
jgi:hypothetical protein